MKKHIPLSRQSGFILVLGAAFFVHVLARAYVLEGVKWSGSHPRVPFYVSTNLAGHAPYNGPFTNGITAINNAANTWSTQGASNLKFFYAGTTDVTNAANDGINAIIFNPGQCPYGGTGCVGETKLYYGADQFLEGFDIVLYGFRSDGLQVNWTAGPFVLGTETDIETIVLHELGHVVGLDHSGVSSVMQAGCAFGCKNHSLANDDIWGIQAIYGIYTNEGIWASNTNPSPGVTVTLYLDYPLAGGRQFQIAGDFDGVNTGCSLREQRSSDSRIFPLDRCFSPMGSQLPTPLEAMVLSANTGTLNSGGQAQVTVQIPNTFECFPTNRQWQFAAVTYNGSAPGGIEDVGVAVALNIQPLSGPSLLVRPAPPPGANQAEVRWQTRSNYLYQMEHSLFLTDWSPFGPLLPAPSSGWLTSMVSIAQSREFFRVKGQPPAGPPCTNAALAIVVSTNHLYVPEGGTASFTVQLNMSGFPPMRRVKIARTGGDTDLQTSGTTEYSFHNNDWNVPRTFTISARQDVDALNGVATFTITGDGMSSVTVTAEEVDDDPP